MALTIRYYQARLTPANMCSKVSSYLRVVASEPLIQTQCTKYKVIKSLYT